MVEKKTQSKAEINAEIINKQTQLTNALREEKLIQDLLLSSEHMLQLSKERLEAVKVIGAIKRDPEQFKIINPVWEFEKNPEYLKHAMKIHEVSNFSEVAQIEQNIPVMEKNIANQKEQLKSTQDHIARLQQELGDLQ